MAIEYNFTLDMDRSKRDNNLAYARTGDVDSITINADLVFNGAAYTPTGTNAFFECITPNGHSIRAAAEKAGSTVSVEVPSAAFQAAGVINVAYFRFESGKADNPTYVESTEPFAIVVREGIGDNIEAGDYIEEWRALADQLEAIVAEVEQKAEQAETAINEQTEEVDQLKAHVQVSMAQDAEDVSDAKDTAISNINGSQGAVDAAIEKLEQKTQEAVDAAQDAIDGTLAADLQNKVNRTLKLDIADMVDISNNTSLSSLTSVGSYCCKTATTAATISDSPIDDSPFNMYVFSSATSGQVMQLVVPIDLQGKPTAEWHVRFGTSSAMDSWSVIGGGADIAAGLGIDVTGDAQKTVALDTTAFYQHHAAADIIQGSTEVTGGGRIKELAVYGNTRQNLWENTSGSQNGVSVSVNTDGSITLSGTSTNGVWIGYKARYTMRPGSTYTLSVDKVPQTDVYFRVESRDVDNVSTQIGAVYSGRLSHTFTVPGDSVYCNFLVNVRATNATVSGTYRIMLNEGDEPEPWCPPGLSSVGELEVACAGKNLAAKSSFAGVTTIDCHVKAGVPITVSFDAQAAKSYKMYFHDEQGIFSGPNEINVTTDAPGRVSQTITLTYNSTSVRSYTENGKNEIVNLVVEYGSTATAYEPPSVTSTPIDLDGYAINSLPDGTRDVLHVDGTGAASIEQNVGDVKVTESFSFSRGSTGEDFYRVNAKDSSVKPSNAKYTNMFCDRFRTDGTGKDFSVIVSSTDMMVSVYIPKSVVSTYEEAESIVKSACPFRIVYQLLSPGTVELESTVVMPDLASPSYAIYASSNIPAEIEAEVVKVDYLPAPDVYTREEVDQKIEDAGGMPDIVPVSQGGTGVTTAAAERKRLGLGNTTGALPIANGGTGATTAKAAEYNILGGMTTNGSDATDASDFAMVRGNLSSADGVLFKRKGTNVWNWIASKIRSTFGFNSRNVLPVANGGTGATSAASARTNLSVYSKAEVNGKVPKVVYGTGNIPSSAENGTIYIQYRS